MKNGTRGVGYREGNLLDNPITLSGFLKGFGELEEMIDFIYLLLAMHPNFQDGLPVESSVFQIEFGMGKVLKTTIIGINDTINYGDIQVFELRENNTPFKTQVKILKSIDKTGKIIIIIGSKKRRKYLISVIDNKIDIRDTVKELLDPSLK